MTPPPDPARSSRSRDGTSQLCVRECRSRGRRCAARLRGVPGRGPAVSRQPLRLAVLEAERTLAAAGVGVAAGRRRAARRARARASPRGQLLLQPLVDPRWCEAAARSWSSGGRPGSRCSTCSARPCSARSTVAVGPGVFTPRPETELLLEWGLRALADVRVAAGRGPVHGSGALALAVAASRPDAVVHAVEARPGGAGLGPAQHLRARRSRRHAGHAARGRRALDRPARRPRGPGRPGAVQPALRPRRHPGAARGGRRGTRRRRCSAARTGWRSSGRSSPRAAGLLRHGGRLAIEHDDTHGEPVPALLRRRRVLTDVEEHRDLAGRPRFATARRGSRRSRRVALVDAASCGSGTSAAEPRARADERAGVDR